MFSLSWWGREGEEERFGCLGGAAEDPSKSCFCCEAIVGQGNTCFCDDPMHIKLLDDKNMYTCIGLLCPVLDLHRRDGGGHLVCIVSSGNSYWITAEWRWRSVRGLCIYRRSGWGPQPPTLSLIRCSEVGQVLGTELIQWTDLYIKGWQGLTILNTNISNTLSSFSIDIINLNYNSSLTFPLAKFISWSSWRS